ncbi:MAG TPA: efflux RND transporter periplasmic adaptor subunit [Bacteroidales bacterium]|nr:efflux RND transporter periplasmic adaptor subunit [Bacteroidales bacterium]HQB21509.1 efflux RND transporter periplasmic adaptor subunit [Bacteroidales bacterium]
MRKNKSKSKKKRTRIIIFGIIGLIIVLIIAKKAGLFGSSDIYEVSTEIVEKRTITEIVNASGKIQPAMEIKLSPDVSGEIVELAVREGCEVKKGDFILKIKPDLYESVLERTIAAGNSANANLENSKARLEQVKAQFIQTKLSHQRNETLYEQGVISQSEFENSLAAYQMGLADVSAAEASVNAAKYSIMSSNASIKEATENLRKTSVFAPMDGTVSLLNVEVGERVVGTEMMAGTEMMRIAKLEDMEVIVDVNENDIVKIKLNDSADIEVDAYLKRKFAGVVTEIANSASSSGVSINQVTNFKVKVKILNESYADLVTENNKYPFRPGMSASVNIHTNTVNDVISLPLAAVTTRVDSVNMKTPTNVEENKDNQENKTTDKSELQEVVFVYKDGKVEQRNVKTGIQDSYYIQIIEGVELKEEVVVAPYNLISKVLKNGTSVKKLSKEELYRPKK